MSAKDRIKKIHAVPHYHFDVEWWKTEEGYNEDVAEILDRALEMLDADEEFTYVIDQALALRPYWRSRPETREKISRYVKEGRIELVGGTLCSPDENIPTGEALARQYVYGKKFLEDEVGGKVETAWEIDGFGHPAQFAQIAARAGMRQFVFARGVQNWRDPAEPIHFLWESPDGTRLLSNWWAAHYIGFSPPSLSAASFAAFKSELLTRADYEGDRTDFSTLMFPFGSDFTPPARKWLNMLSKWRAGGGSPKVEFSLPRRFFDELREESGDEFPVVTGELNPLLTGCYESREKVKRLCRKSQYSIMDAEKWAAIAWSRGAEYPKEKLDSAWELILTNDFHDIVCGTGTDKVYRNTLRRYSEAMAAIEEVGASAREKLAALADTRGAGVPFVAFNSLNWERRAMLRVPTESLGDIADCETFSAVGPAGEPLRCQLSDGHVLVHAILPAMGFAVLNIKPGAKSQRGGLPKPSDLSVSELCMENEYLRATLDPRTGCLVSVFDKETGRETLDCSRYLGNELLAEEDAGNLWTVQKTGEAWEGKRYRSAIKLIESGPVRAGFEARGRHKDMDRVQRVYLEAGSRRVDFETDINFKGRDMRVKAMFGAAAGGKPVFETPFYSEPRNPGHWCAQNWVDISNGKRGLAVLNSGNPGMDAETDCMGLVLFRSVSVFSAAYLRYLARNMASILRASAEAKEIMKKGLGHAEWALYEHHGISLREWSSEGGMSMKGVFTPDHLAPFIAMSKPAECWERGSHSFRYAIYPHAGDWKAASLPRAGVEFNTPVVALARGKAKGSLGRSASLFSAGEDAAAIMVALKKAEKSDALAARVYDALGDGSKLRFSNPGPAIARARKTNITEDEKGGALRVNAGTALASLSKWEIGTYLLELSDGKK